MEEVKGLEQREDTWWITEKVMTAACITVAEQFVNDENTNTYPDWHSFAARAEYVMRQMCPIVYSYFFQHAKPLQASVLPKGTLEIIQAEILRQRPLFQIGTLS